MTQWTDFVKEYAGKNNISYGCALSDKTVSEAYREKYPKKETKKQKLLTTKRVMSEVLKQLPKKEETVVKYTPPKITDKNRMQLAQKQFDEWEGGVLEDPDETMRYGGKIVSVRHEERDPEWMAEYPFGKADYAVILNDEFMHHFISRNAERQYNTEREKVLKKINEKYGTTITKGSFFLPNNVKAPNSFQSYRAGIEDMSLRDIYPPEPTKAEVKAKEKAAKAELKAKEKAEKKKK